MTYSKLFTSIFEWNSDLSLLIGNRRMVNKEGRVYGVLNMLIIEGRNALF